MKSRNVSLLIVFAVFIGVVVGLVISSNLDLTNNSIAADDQATPVQLGRQDDSPISQELADLQAMSTGFAQVVEQVKGSVVTIKSSQTVETQVPEFWEYFFNVPEERVRRGLGSGVVVNKDGYIITNNHVVEDADELQVPLGEQTYDAEVIGRDPESDLAVIKIDADNLSPIKLGNSDNLAVGEWVLAIGNPFSELLDQTVTAGIVSAKGRTGLTRGQISFEDFIQTDASINPGNSGGALVNLRGELVGINTMIFSASGGNVGIGFAIPINLAKNVMQQLIEKGRVTRGFLGVTISPLDDATAEAFGLDEPRGALVNEVNSGSPAEEAGIQEGDIILRVNNNRVEDSNDLMNKIAAYSPGTDVELLVWRDESEKEITVELGERPGREELMAGRTNGGDAETVLGMEVANLTAENMRRFNRDYEGEEGVLVVGVDPGSVAARENIQPGDLITQVNRKDVNNISEFNGVVKDLEPNDVVLFRMKRGDSNFYAGLRVPEEE